MIELADAIKEGQLDEATRIMLGTFGDLLADGRLEDIDHLLLELAPIVAVSVPFAIAVLIATDPIKAKLTNRVGFFRLCRERIEADPLCALTGLI